MVVCTHEEAPMLDTVNLQHLQETPTADILDRQHLQIKREQQDLRTAIKIGANMDQIIACAEDLIATTLRHFESEEIAMEANKFKDLAAHKCFHLEMIESLKEFSSDLERRKISDAMELMKFFDVRLTYHFGFEDGAFERELSAVQK
jgi:hemerythrin-like metal-binding protein